MRAQPLLIVLTVLSTISAFSQKEVEISSFDPFQEMIESVVESDSSDPYEKEVPYYLEDIICEIYSDATVSDSIPIDVLSFVTEIFSEHGYYESGNWAPTVSNKKYIPYKGHLPDYTIKDFIMPVSGRLTSGFGYRHRFHRYHKGVDVALHQGDTVVAALPGVVIKTGFEPKGYGSYVVVAHSGNVETIYAHLKGALVVDGQHLKAGAPLGLGGNTGNSTGPHLHFEIRHKGVAINPESWFDLEAYRK